MIAQKISRPYGSMKNPAAQSLGRLGGLKTSEAKTAAARANGRKGGRPKTTTLNPPAKEPLPAS